MKFSIITPSYNQGQFIAKTIESVITQEGDFEVEFFVIDGGSTDGTVEVIKYFEKKIKRSDYKGLNRGTTLRWQSKKDNGQSDAINQGLKQTTGDVVAYINSDDYYEKDCFARVMVFFEDNPKKLWLTGYCRIVDAEDKQIQKIITKYKNFWLNYYHYRNLLVLNFIPQPATFWRRSAIVKVGFFNENLHYAMDYDYWLRLGKRSNPVIVKDYLTSFRIHSSSKGKEQYLKQFNEDMETANKYCQNSLIIVLHSLHNLMIKSVYLLVKR